MSKHHPMDRLHEHLNRATEHAAQVHAEAHKAVADRATQAAAERENGGRETLPESGR